MVEISCNRLLWLASVLQGMQNGGDKFSFINVIFINKAIQRISKKLKLYVIHCRPCYLQYITYTSTKKHYKLDLPPLQPQRVGSKFMCWHQVPAWGNEDISIVQSNQSPLMSASECRKRNSWSFLQHRWVLNAFHLTLKETDNCVLCTAFIASTKNTSFKDITTLIIVIFL